LIDVILAAEKRLPSAQETGQDAADAPNIEGVVVGLEAHEEFRTLVVTGRYTNIVSVLWYVKVSQAQINESQWRVSDLSVSAVD
jgi:hypothetical protein